MPAFALSDSGSTIPADLQAAIQATEADRALMQADTATVTAATKSLTDANASLATHTAQFAKDKTTLRALWNSYYPPDPSPTPAPAPPAPAPPTPPAPPADVVTLSLISNTGTAFACPACDSVHAESVPTLKSSLGANFSEYAYTDAANVGKLYPATTADPQSRYIPRWVLTHSATGTTVKASGYMTLAQLQGWIAGTYTPPTAH